MRDSGHNGQKYEKFPDRLIGQGSFGKVFVGRRKYTNQPVAMKIIDSSRADDLQIRTENSVLKMLHHENIIEIYDSYDSDEGFVIISELGCCNLRRAAPIPNEDRFRSIAFQLVSALTYCHSHHVVHRDLKLENILIDFHGRVKICDFGLAKVLRNREELMSSKQGTVLTMAPELVSHQPYNRKVDIWALGISLYELSYGEIPFKGRADQAVITNRILNWPGLSPDPKAPRSADFMSFLGRMLVKEEGDRASAEELLNHPFLRGYLVPKNLSSDQSYRRRRRQQFQDAVPEVHPQPEPPLDILQVLKDCRAHLENKSQQPEPKLSNHRRSQFLSAFEQIGELGEKNDEAVLAEFQSCFDMLMKKKKWKVYVMNAACRLPQPERFVSGIQVLGDLEFKPHWVHFFVGLLCLPTARAILRGERQFFPLNLDEQGWAKLANDLVELIQPVASAEILAVFHWFVRFAPGFAGALDPRKFAKRVLKAPERNARAKTHLQSAFFFAIVQQLLGGDPNFVLDIEAWVDWAVDVVSRGQIDQIASFAKFSAALSFLSLVVEKHRAPDVALRMEQIFSDEHVDAMLHFGSREPEAEEDLLAYLAMTASPFVHLQCDEPVLRKSLAKAASLQLPHKIQLVRRLFDARHVASLSDVVVPLLSDPSISELLHALLAAFMQKNRAKRGKLAAQFVRDGILSGLAQNIETRSFELAACIVLSLPAADSVIPAVSAEVFEGISVLFNALVVASEQFGNHERQKCVTCLLRIAAHLAKLDPSHAAFLVKNKALDLVDFGLRSSDAAVRCKAARLVGRLALHEAAGSWEQARSIIELLFGQLASGSQEVKLWASFAIANVFFQIPRIPDDWNPLVEAGAADLVALIGAEKIKMSGNAIAAVWNCIKKNEHFVAVMTRLELPKKLSQLLEKSEPADAREGQRAAKREAQEIMELLQKRAPS